MLIGLEHRCRERSASFFPSLCCTCHTSEAAQALSVVVAETVVLLCFTRSTLVTTAQAFGADEQGWGAPPSGWFLQRLSLCLHRISSPVFSKWLLMLSFLG